MNTPTHAVFNLLALSRRERPEWVWPVLIGAVLPDLPMVAFYLWEKLVLRAPEAVIWSQDYHQPAWQAVFDLLHSFPLAFLGLGIALVLRWDRLRLLATSLALHSLGDLPLHHDDGHRHLWPLSDWRFQSPVSYWDPAYHGEAATLVEMSLLGVGLVVLWRRHPEPRIRAALAFATGVCLLYAAFVASVWL